MSIVAVEGANSKVGSLLVSTLASKGFHVYVNLRTHAYEAITGFVESNNITNINTDTPLSQALLEQGINYNHLVHVMKPSYFSSVSEYIEQDESNISDKSEGMIQMYKQYTDGASFSSTGEGKVVYLYEKVKKQDKRLPTEGIEEEGYGGNHIQHIEYLINKSVGETLTHLAEFENLSVSCIEVASNIAGDLEYLSYRNSTTDANESIVDEVVNILT